MLSGKKIAVAIPCFKVDKHIMNVISTIGNEVDIIYVVDDCCPHKTGDFVMDNNHDPRVRIIYHDLNLGVGGAVKTAYSNALKDKVDIVVKIDGDGQMDPSLIPKFLKPILDGKADYTKGSRFFSLQSLMDMPTVRKIGNACLSFVNKASSGYWNIMDPTNGYTAINREALSLLPLEKVSNRYFFESDMLFRLGTIRAVVKDIAMDSVYEEEESNLSIKKVLLEFPPLYTKCFFKRIFYNYFLRDFNAASMELVIGWALYIFGVVWGSIHWTNSYIDNENTSVGTVMIAVLPIIMGFQLLLNGLNYDMSNIPKEPLSEHN
ncbi:glycosyltransferase family 2 protein [Vibrio sp. 10N.261.51.F11]|uniref:glycosyltransferase family 2 protein n=1 Tax=Vibrio sp. 10N.261.51.F11 TaxID=3229678 RepID=UPI00354FDD49